MVIGARWTRRTGQLNDQALMDGDRLLSAYATLKGGKKLWVITEADRSSTWILRPRSISKQFVVTLTEGEKE